MNTAEAFSKSFSKIQLPLHGVRLPSFNIEAKYKRDAGLSEDVDNYEFLRGLCRKGFSDLGIDKDSEDYKKYTQRVKFELETIKELGFVDYILLVWSVVNFCKENDIPTGLGRGSAAGSLVLFLVGATGIDPIKYNLFFERFISRIRAKKQIIDGVTYLDGSLMCDVDIDICYYNRHKVISYLESKFSGKTSKILTLNTLSGKLLIKECGKILGEKAEVEMTSVSALIPKVFGQVKDLEEAYLEVEKFKEWADANREVYETALKLRDLIKNKGVHPSGVLLSHDDLSENCPTEFTSDSNSVSGYDMNWGSILNVKLDILGLRSVSVVDDVCKSIGIKVKDINLNDLIIYQNLQELKTPHGLFQIEADTNFRVCQKVRPKNLEQLSAVLALARPGALAFVDQYALFTNHDTYSPIHPFFDETLKDTGGVALYQEQLMKMANKIGFTLDEAEILRRIVGKKKIDEVKAWKEKINLKCKENNLSQEIGDILWRVLEDSANYSFNKSHSIAYAALAAITTYLKFKHPQQFFLSLLKMTRHEPDPMEEISKIQKEFASFNMQLLPPHMIKSEMDFSIEGKDIRFGLLSIKGISDKSIEKINGFRNKYANKFEIFQAAEEAGLGIGTLSSLIQAGALEGFKQSRSKVVLEAQLWNILTEKEKKFCVDLGDKFAFDLVNLIKHLLQFKDTNGKAIIKESRYATIKKRYAPYLEIYQQNSKSENLANWFYEKTLLGYTYNKTLKDIFATKRSDLQYINKIEDLTENARTIFIGIIKEVFSGVSKNKNKYLKFVISDETGTCEAMIFKDKIDECKNLNGSLPEEKNMVIVKGVKKGGNGKFASTVFADLIAIQDQAIYTKLSQIKNIDKKEKTH